jgi:hypothetical protein
MNITTKYLALASIALLTACQKEEDAPTGPVEPIHRQLFADFTDADTSALRVVIDRATQDNVPYAWKNVIGHTYVLCTLGGYQGNVYRNDNVRFISNATIAASIPVRLDDIQTFTVNVDPASNGQVVYQTVLDW